jgi:cytochrome c oxidase assembly protein subunit 15
MLTAIACLVAAIRQRRIDRSTTGNPSPDRSSQPLLLAASPLIGTVAQAVVGGLTVLTGLSPWWVALHFLVSTGIIAATQVYVVRVSPGLLTAGPAQLPGRWLILGASAVLILGTAVTGAGPHAGDADVVTRFPWHPLAAMVLHSSAAWTLLVFVFLCVRRTQVLPKVDTRRIVSRRLLLLLTLQAAIGYTQTALNLNAALVGVHVGLAVLTWSGAVRLAAVAQPRL